MTEILLAYPIFSSFLASNDQLVLEQLPAACLRQSCSQYSAFAAIELMMEEEQVRS
jgi:hypothetical protein